MTKYPLLVFISTALGFAGWLFLFGGGLIFLWGLSDLVNGVSSAGQTNFQDFQVAALAGLHVLQGWIKVSGGMGLATSGLVWIAISEAVRVLIDIESNTAQTASNLRSGSASLPTNTT